jgi:hypothetical protein
MLAEGAVTTQILAQHLIYPFCLAISLGMKSGGQIGGDAKARTQLAPEARTKL